MKEYNFSELYFIFNYMSKGEYSYMMSTGLESLENLEKVRNFENKSGSVKKVKKFHQYFQKVWKKQKKTQKIFSFNFNYINASRVLSYK